MIRAYNPFKLVANNLFGMPLRTTGSKTVANLIPHPIKSVRRALAVRQIIKSREEKLIQLWVFESNLNLIRSKWIINIV